MELVFGSVVVAIAAFLAGTTRFRFALISIPFLLLIGFPLEFVVTANLTLLLITRISVFYRFRNHVSAKRGAMLIFGSLPGLYLGTKVLLRVDPSVIKLSAGAFVMISALLLLRTVHAPPPARVLAASAVAGFAGGFLGTTTSLSGIPPVLLLAHEKAAPVSFLADMAFYFVVSSSVALLLLASQGALATQALFPAALIWLPGAMVGNSLGTTLGPRLPEKTFRYLTLGVVFIAGGITAVTA
ncbi:sulfite exporter TauE/SafE family protein [soil metagenome]